MVLERLLWRVTCLNPASFCLLKVARSGFCGPTRNMILLCTQSFGLVLQVGDTKKCPHALDFKSLDPFFWVSKQGACFAATGEDGGDYCLTNIILYVSGVSTSSHQHKGNVEHIRIKEQVHSLQRSSSKCKDLQFQEAKIPVFPPVLCTCAFLFPQRTCHIQPQTMCHLKVDMNFKFLNYQVTWNTKQFNKVLNYGKKEKKMINQSIIEISQVSKLVHHSVKHQGSSCVPCRNTCSLTRSLPHSNTISICQPTNQSN